MQTVARPHHRLDWATNPPVCTTQHVEQQRPDHDPEFTQDASTQTLRTGRITPRSWEMGPRPPLGPEARPVSSRGVGFTGG